MNFKNFSIVGALVCSIAVSAGCSCKQCDTPQGSCEMDKVKNMSITESAKPVFDLREHIYAVEPEYLALWSDDVQREIDQNIEKNRKADGVFQLGVTAGTKVKVEQISHSFIFGAQIFNFGQLGSPERNQKYQALWGRLFNQATIPFYWKDFEPQEGHLRLEPTPEDDPKFWENNPDKEKNPFWRRPRPTPIIDFCDKYGIRKHGHLMAWANSNPARHLPAWLLAKIPQEILDDPQVKAEQAKSKTGTKLFTPESVRPIFQGLSADEFAAKYPDFVAEFDRCWYKYVTDLATNFGDKIDSWDVVNEAAIEVEDNYLFSGQSEHLVPGSKICRSFYGIAPGDYVYETFRLAEKSLPAKVLLIINDYAALDPKLADSYIRLVENLKSRQVKLDSIGNQVHIFRKQMMLDIAAGKYEAFAPRTLLESYRKQAATGIPVRISEITIPNPTKDVKGESMQAVVAWDLFRLWFSVENMQGITWWNLVDNISAGDEKMQSGILRKDMSEKPVFKALDQLINHEWKTKTEVVAAADGSVSFRGFRGKYILSWVDADGKTGYKEVELK